MGIQNVEKYPTLNKGIKTINSEEYAYISRSKDVGKLIGFSTM